MTPSTSSRMRPRSACLCSTRALNIPLICFKFLQMPLSLRIAVVCHISVRTYPTLSNHHCICSVISSMVSTLEQNTMYFAPCVFFLPCAYAFSRFCQVRPSLSAHGAAIRAAPYSFWQLLSPLSVCAVALFLEAPPHHGVHPP